MTDYAALARGLADALSAIPGVRVWEYAPDPLRPPALIVGPPSMDWTSPDRTWGGAAVTFPLSLAVARPTEREAQRELLGLISQVEEVLIKVPDVQYARLTSASPTVVSASGVDYPGYNLTVEVLPC